MSKRRGLGKGLGSLIGNTTSSSKTDAQTINKVKDEITTVSAKERRHNLQSLPVEAIQRGQFQPRRHFEQAALTELAASIKAQGILQPIVVRALPTPGQDAAQYEIIAGERRWRAAQLAGLAEIPVVIRNLDDETTAAVALIENIQREDLNPLEEAQALQRLLEEFAMTHQQAADVVGRSRAAVSNLIRLLDLTPMVKERLGAGQLDMGHARALLGLSPSEQEQLAEQIVSQQLSVRETERRVKQLGQPRPKKPATNEHQADIRRLEQTMADSLGTMVKIKHQKSGKGTLTIQYSDLNNLDQVIQKLGISQDL